MTLRDFIDAAYALAEDPQRSNPLADLVAEERPARAAPVEAQNEQSLNLLNQMMSGVQRKR